MKKYDVIVVGAGMGGLACACVLAKNKKRVLLLEQGHSAGGFANSFVRGRFEFEVSLHELCGFGRYDMPFGPVRGLFNYLGISDRILVMSDGRLAGELSRDEANQEKIMSLATKYV